MTGVERTATLAGVCGGVGATRIAVETATALARGGHDAVVLDAAPATQGLADYVPGAIDPDLTRVLADGEPLAAAVVDLPVAVPGRVAAAPSAAPFERLARAETAEAGRRFEEAMATAAASFDHVVVDAPPVATNLAVAAATAAGRVGLVVPPSERGVNALQRVRGRLADVGGGVDLVVANRAGGGHPVGRADLTVPDVTLPASAPAAGDAGHALAPAVTRLAEALFDVEIDDGGGGIVGAVVDRVTRRSGDGT